MDCKKSLYSSVDNLVNAKNFDLVSFTYNFKRMVDNIIFFHNIIGKNATNSNDLSKIQYRLTSSQRPLEGQIAYFYIENSYPKEIFNSHWCLVLKDLGNTMTIIPTTSIKEDTTKIDRSSEIMIKIKDFEEDGCSRLKIHQLFSADILRIDKSKKIYDLQTDFGYIKEEVKKILNL